MNLDVTKLNPEQSEAVKHQFGPLLILAGAGSGKTRVITHRIAYLIDEYNVSPYNILAITFTNKAAKEMQERVNSLVEYGAENVWVSTFHSTCVRMLRKFGESLGYDSNFSIYDTDDQKALMRRIIKKHNLDPKKYREKFFLNRISAAKNELLGPDDLQPSSPKDSETALVVKIYRDYQEQLRENNAMDFDDLLMNTVIMFRDVNCPALTYYRNRFRYIMVDEYQDTNTAQFEFIRLLAHYENDEGEVECNLCVVGDDDQSIYGFRGADIKNILSFEKTYPDAKVIKLEQNYRSTEHILNAANSIIHNNHHVNEKKLWTRLGEGTPIEYTIYDSDVAEAQGVAECIRDQVDNGLAEYHDFAVLFRTNAQSRIFEQQMNRLRIPNKIIGNIAFYQRKEIKDILAYLKTIDNGLDGLAVRRVLNVPKRGIGETTMAHIQEFAERNDCSYYDALTYADSIPTVKRAAAAIREFTEIIERYRQKLNSGCSLKELVTDLLEDLNYEDELRAEDDETADDRINNINELINAITSYEDNASEPPTLGGFLSEVALVSDLDTVAEVPDYVVLMTIHSAKGLEFEQVFLVGMEDGLFPSSMSMNDWDDEADDSGIEEERRLCYVGITRAKQKLYLSRALTRMARGEMQYNGESRFIKELKKQARHLINEKNLSETGGFNSGYGSRQRGGYGDSYSSGNDYGNRTYGSANSYGNRGSYGSGSDYSDRRDSYRGDSGSYGYGGGSTGSRTGYTHGSATEYGAGNGRSLDDFLAEAAARKKPETKPYDNPYRVPKVPVARTIGSSDSSCLGYAVGDRVRHERFGVGTVTNIVKGTRDFEVTVDFPSGTKKMLAAFAKLQKE